MIARQSVAIAVWRNTPPAVVQAPLRNCQPGAPAVKSLWNSVRDPFLTARFVYSTRVFQAANPTAPCLRSAAAGVELGLGTVFFVDLKMCPRNTNNATPTPAISAAVATSAMGKGLRAFGSVAGTSGTIVWVGRGLSAVVAERRSEEHTSELQSP